MNTTKPRVAVIGTGGTISSLGHDSLDVSRYGELRRMLEVDELLARFPEVHTVADVMPVRYRALPSMALGPREWIELVRFIHALVESTPQLDGIVLTHGTATLEETAYFLNLTLKIKQPVIVVGSQRPATALSTDAGLNLVNAIRTAGSEGARGMGVLVVLNDEIHAAREVTKTSSTRLQTFRAPDFGALGHADGDRIAFYRAPLRRRAPDTAFRVDALDDLPRVDIALAYAGADGVAVDAYVAAGARGIVAAGFPPGFSTVAQLEALERAQSKGIVVVQSHRGGSGRLAPVNFARPTNVVLADNLTPQKARILLMLAMSITTDRGEIQRMFEDH